MNSFSVLKLFVVLTVRFICVPRGLRSDGRLDILQKRTDALRTTDHVMKSITLKCNLSKEPVVTMTHFSLGINGIIKISF